MALDATRATLVPAERVGRLSVQLQHPLDQLDHPVMPRLDIARKCVPGSLLPGSHVLTHGLATLDDGLGLATIRFEDGLNNMVESPPCNGDNLGVLRRCIKDESVGAPDGRSG
jgi:hypothetical protein